jgi:hypothetical protein
MGPSNIKVESHVEWEKMFKKLEVASDEEIQGIWEALKEYDPTEHYAPGITMDSWAQAVHTEMDLRGMSHITQIKGRRNNYVGSY